MCMLFFLMSCSKTDRRSNQLLAEENVTKKEVGYLKKRDFLNENEKIIYIYTPTKITVQAVLLTDEKIVAYSRDTVETELLSNIFDLSASHSIDKEKPSTITIYRKDDSTFKLEFAGASDADEKIFLKIRDMWRIALSENETQVPASDTTEDTVSRE